MEKREISKTHNLTEIRELYRKGVVSFRALSIAFHELASAEKYQKYLNLRPSERPQFIKES